MHVDARGVGEVMYLIILTCMHSAYQTLSSLSLSYRNYNLMDFVELHRYIPFKDISHSK